MNLMGLVMEVQNQGAKKVNWLTYWIGCLAGIVPWIVFTLFMSLVQTRMAAVEYLHLYTFIYASMFIFFSSFRRINMYLQYKKTGKWSDYMYGERTYMILSLVAKTALAWQVFAGTLRP
jgi:hypothetical protein